MMLGYRMCDVWTWRRFLKSCVGICAKGIFKKTANGKLPVESMDHGLLACVKVFGVVRVTHLQCYGNDVACGNASDLA